MADESGLMAGEIEIHLVLKRSNSRNRRCGN
jgi:hypothetical protein